MKNVNNRFRDYWISNKIPFGGYRRRDTPSKLGRPVVQASHLPKQPGRLHHINAKEECLGEL